MEENKETKPGAKARLNWIIAVAVAIIIATIVIVESVNTANSQKEKEAVKLLNKVYSDAIEGGAECEDAGNMISKVWHNAIFETEDPATDTYTRYNKGLGGFMNFNDALSNYFLKGDYSKKVGSAEAYGDYIGESLKGLNNIPKKFSEEYVAAKKVRSTYGKLLNIVNNPTGNIGTFTSNINEADKNLSSACDDLKYLLEDIKN